MSNEPTPSPQIPQKLTPVRKVGIGLAVVALPVAAAMGLWQLKQHDDATNEELEQGFRYDDVKLRQIDPALIGYTQVSQIQTAMQKPTCMAMGADGKLYVAGNALVKVFDPKGQELRSFAITGEPTAIAADAAGQVYLALRDHVEVFSSSGSRLATWSSLGPKSHISSVAVAADRVYVADSGQRNGRVLAYGLDGSNAGEIARADVKAGIKGIVTPSPHMDVAVTSDGNIWVANPGHRQLELYSPSGELLRHFGEAGTQIHQFLGCCNPSDFALLSDGRIVTAEKGIPRIKVFQDDGHFESVVAGPDSFGSNRAGIDIATDSAGRILVLEPGTTSIRVFAAK